MAHISGQGPHDGFFVLNESGEAKAHSHVPAALQDLSCRVSNVWQRGSVDKQDMQGKLLFAPYTSQSGKPLASETATRIPGQKALSVTLRQSFVQLNKEELACRGMLAECAKGSLEEQRLQGKLETITKKLEIICKTQKNLETDAVADKRKFFDSNYHRAFMIQQLKQAKGKPLDGALYKELADKASPGLINARHINLVSEAGETHGLLRLGVMSDLRNGTTNLRDLKKIVANPALKDIAVRKLQKERDAYKPQTAAYASLQMAIQQLTNAEAALLERSERMNLQMLQYLTAQAERQRPAGDSWNVVDIRLLDPGKRQMDKKCGWVHSEANELLDMAEVFKEFNGKRVVLGSDGPHIDGDTIFIPLPDAKPGDKQEVTLSATLLNISIQTSSLFRSPKNQGLQAEINRQALDNLRKLGNTKLFEDPDWKSMCKSLEKGESTGVVAEEAVTALMRNGNFSVSVGCLSAKDRTGFVVGRSMIKLVAKNDAALRRFLTQQLLSAGSISSQILKDVTGWSHMKLSFSTLGNDVSVAVRLRYMAGLIAETAVDILKKQAAKVSSLVGKTLATRKLVPIFLPGG